MRIWIVVLRFVHTTRVDIVPAESDQAAAADFIARCLAAPHPPDLPLLGFDTCEVPPDRLRELAAEVPEPKWTPPPAPSLPVVGLCAAVRAYHVALADNAENAEARLRAFVEHYGARIDFSTNRAAVAAT